MSLIIGILGALKTDKIKRFIAYAAINQMGFLLLGIFVYAINVVLIYFIFYILTTLMIFMVILKTIPLSKATVFELTFTADLKILSFYNKTIRLYLLIILFSMAGLPPFITSFSK
jgi:NADH:ubiquinone oxidoreductase subunit 2 (subunit N)